jgi:hypothetical protein
VRDAGACLQGNDLGGKIAAQHRLLEGNRGDPKAQVAGLILKEGK